MARRPRVIASVVGLALALPSACALWPTRAAAQEQAPIAGHYPGGHVGIRGGATPGPGIAYGGFLRVQSIYALKNDSGDTVENESTSLFANINVLSGVTKTKLLGGAYGWMLVVPFNEQIDRPNSLNGLETGGFGLGDIALIPLALYRKSKAFDWQAGVGAFVPPGEFEGGGSTNHGTGFWTPLLSLGAVWYPGGKRDSWSGSAVSRWEFNGTQEDTDIEVGDEVVVDWGSGS